MFLRVRSKSKECPVTDVQDTVDSSQAQGDEALQRFADGFSSPPRSPVLHSPSEHHLKYEDVTFAAYDGVPIEVWFIPAPGSSKLIIANHPLGFSRSGIPTHVEPWHTAWAPTGNGFEVDLVPDYKILHDAGYDVLTCDLRNHGFSGAANGGVVTHGYTESRGVVGSLEYARMRSDTSDMTIGLFSRCMAASPRSPPLRVFPPTRLSTAGWTASHNAAAPRAGGVRHGQDMPDATQSQQ
jgi:hypothetical protein